MKHRIGLKFALLLALALVALPLISNPVAAADGEVDSGDTAWLMISTGLVFIMTPAVAFFYGGMLRKSNFLSMLGQSILIIGVVTIIWVLFGYSLTFGTDQGGLIGDAEYLMLNGVDLVPNAIAPTVPHILFMMYQGMFAIITVALIIGGVAERMKLSSLIVFLSIWTAAVYIPVAHWVWGGGWIYDLGALDFAGGTVVHITAGVSVLAAALVLGKRINQSRGGQEVPHNIPMVVLGGALLWIGWFGFNGGSALAANGLAANALVVTHISAAMAASVWGLISWLDTGRVSVLGLISGGVAGLVAITPAAGFVNPTGALFIGLGAAVVCYGGILLRKRLGFDDALDVWGVHGLGGTFGAIATGLFATTAVNAAGKDGLLYGGGADLLVAQTISVIVVWAFAFGVTFVILKAISMVMPLRMTKDEEKIGADIIQHGESAYYLR
ncbi:MAG TPA: ammonium transporter [Methanomassiliicoccales archaeon]|nr:ammonium transporter [Methanomassiliicoccales archaeon]HPR98296.1 ammonium transporter [Methanomassiliicoccales archaeon]